MRTTLTLDDDVASLLEKEVRRTGEPLKVTVNALLRSGLQQAAATVEEMMFTIHAHPTVAEALLDGFSSVEGKAVNV